VLTTLVISTQLLNGSLAVQQWTHRDVSQNALKTLVGIHIYFIQEKQTLEENDQAPTHQSSPAQSLAIPMEGWTAPHFLVHT